MLTGAADSGHELLLRVIGLLEAPDRGEMLLSGAPVHGLGEAERVALRDRRIGFVFAAPFLLPAFTPIENVAMPLFKISDADTSEAQRRSEALLDFVGLPELVQVPCSELGAFNQHRVSLARALVNKPSLLLIEKLDAALAGDDLRVFAALARQAAARFGVAVIATVSPGFPPESADRVIEITDGAVQRDSELLPRSDA
jgi:ABC-type lipoprotein export system ATPase subunit